MTLIDTSPPQPLRRDWEAEGAEVHSALCPNCEDWKVSATQLGDTELRSLVASDTPEHYAACPPQSSLEACQQVASRLLVEHMEGCRPKVRDHRYWNSIAFG